MESCRVKARFCNPVDFGRSIAVDALVDTGSTDCGLPASSFRELGITPYREKEYEIAGGNGMKLPAGEAMVEVDGERATVPVTFDPDGATPTLGAIVLESLGFMPDSVGRRLLPVRRYKL